MSILKLGIIGFSEGNGHPYSWSAIFNGYDPALMAQCGFPTIPQYLSRKNFPQDCIKNTKVTHLWTQDYSLSCKIAKTTFITNVVSEYTSMIGKVDAVLLARDDSSKHPLYAIPFLKAGIPIYIDKPLATNVAQATKLISSQLFAGQLFSCSALAYSSDLILTNSLKERVGQIMRIEATAPNDWERYSVHIIEPTLNLIPNSGKVLRYKALSVGKQRHLSVEFENSIQAKFSTTGLKSTEIQIQVYGTKGNCILTFENIFDAFKSALQDFVDSISQKDVRSPEVHMLRVVELISLGCKT